MRSILGTPDRLATHPPALGVQRFDRRDQSRPRHDALHVGEKSLASRLLFLHRVLGAGKAALADRGAGFLGRSTINASPAHYDDPTS